MIAGRSASAARHFYSALRRDELCRLTVKDRKHERRGVAHLKVSGNGSKTCYVPLHYWRDVVSQKSLMPDAVYKIVQVYLDEGSTSGCTRYANPN